MLIILVGCSAKGVPTDEGLEAFFKANESSFDKLAAMAEKEKVLFNLHPGVPVNPPEYKEKAQEYIDLLEEIGIEEPSFTMHRTDKGLFLGVWTKKWGDASVRRILRYSSIPATPEAVMKRSTDKDSLRPLSPNWRLQVVTDSDE